jgi:2-keto-4-pentenoate hydratase/2-oxohepta-3-ene-1,7-dioic acid hydratase in catechol pathway
MVCKSTRVRIARFLLRSTSRPRVGLERDGTIYDVEALEQAIGGAVEVPGDAWDFHTRVAALGCAGLRELDAALLQGRRPATAVVPQTGFAALAPCDTERALYAHVDPSVARRPAVRLGCARTIAGQDALVDLPRGETRPVIEIGVAVVLGEDLRDATTREAENAIAGYTVLVDWCARDTERAASPGATVRSLRAQLGPTLAAATTIPKPASLRVSLGLRGARHEVGSLGDLGLSPGDAVALASTHLELRAGDVVGIGPLPLGPSGAREITLAYHERVEVSIERLGTLRGAAVERR